MGKIGKTVGELIGIKDRLKSELYSAEIDALNDACNILYHNFDSQADCYDIIEKGKQSKS